MSTLVNAPPARLVTATPADALTLARASFLKGERLDMRRLASELGVSRTTLYRWVGDRELLLADVLWMLLQENIDRCTPRAAGHGPDRLIRLVELVNQEILRSRPLAQYVAAEPESALRVLTAPGSPLQARTIAAWRSVLDQAVAAGEIAPRMDTGTLALVLVRVSQSFLWPELVAGAPADTSQASEVYRALLS